MKRSIFVSVVLMLACAAGSDTRSAGAQSSGARSAEDYLRVLRLQGVQDGRIMGLDSDGVPLVCATGETPRAPAVGRSLAGAAMLPEGTRGWEAIPGVIRSDGLESFRLEVFTGGPVAGVRMPLLSTFLIAPGPAPFDLTDDGDGADRTAGDFTFTAGPFRYDTEKTHPDFIGFDPASPEGLFVNGVGTIEIEELDGAIATFLLPPQFGLLRPEIAPTTVTQLSADIIASPHLINIRTSTRETQRFIRLLGGDLSNLTSPIYEVHPDTIDFFMFFSTNKIEMLPRVSSSNFTVGVHFPVSVDYTGTGLAPFNNAALFGSGGALLGMNVLDYGARGLESGNAGHEIMHQWASFTDPDLGLSDGTAHYNSRSSAASLLGGFDWIDNGDGTFTRDCNVGRNRAFRAPPIDLYMMGLIDGSEVGPIQFSDPAGALDCNEVVDDVVGAVSVLEIQARHGERLPGPSTAQRDFRLAFVAETHNRLFNQTEMTFYDILAAHFTSPIDAEAPDPIIGSNWASIARFFGDGVTWSSEIQPGPNPTPTPTATPAPTPPPSAIEIWQKYD